MKKFAIIVAGGSGTRMKSKVPKQFLILDDEPIIIKTIRKFESAVPDIEVIVVLPKSQLDHWDNLVDQFPFVSKVLVTYGGDTRTDSVISGLAQIQEDGLVAVHDAVRPYVPTETILSSFASAEKFGSGVAAVPLKDSIRELYPGKKSKARNRSNFVLVQTPQTFDVARLKEAYAMIEDTIFTDDASVFENAGEKVYLVEGSYSNIKITTPDDLK